VLASVEGKYYAVTNPQRGRKTKTWSEAIPKRLGEGSKRICVLKEWTSVLLLLF